VIVDADAISHFKHTPDALAESRGRLILTPHTGEMARLLGLTSAEVDAERLETLAHAVEKTRATVLLKGPHTMVGSPGKLPVIGSLGSTVLATGGAGDVLTGVVAALACELEPFEAAHVGAYIHAHAGQIWAREVGADRGLLAHEIAERVPRAMAAL
jgi:NAD(P)H-hydrate epimerase